MLKKKLISSIHKIAPKKNRVMVMDNFKGETNAIAMANYIAEHYDYEVYYIVKKELVSKLEPLIHKKVFLTEIGSSDYKKASFTSKYVFSTHGYSKVSKRQKTINLWHGVGHKKINIARGMGGHYADYTIATSEFTQEMFAYFFGVEESNVLVTGYPRNDELLNTFQIKSEIKKQVGPEIQGYDKILFWMPTHRRKEAGIAFSSRGQKVENIFNVGDFDIARFNNILKENNTLCLIKPHYYYLFDQNESKDMTHIRLVNEEWIWDKKLNLYQLLACADVLVTDFSSVMTDFSLLDKPIICFCSDLEEVREKDELYFEDIENYLPSQLLETQEAFFSILEKTLRDNEDVFMDKRRKMRNLYFKDQDANSAKRIAEQILG